MNIITKKTKNEYLKSKSRFYIAGWFDAERGEQPQKSTREKDLNIYKDYLKGYFDSIENEFTMGGV
jgi:hypothetical protein